MSAFYHTKYFHHHPPSFLHSSFPGYLSFELLCCTQRLSCKQSPQLDPCVLINLSIVEEYDTYEGKLCSMEVFECTSLATPVLFRNLILLMQPEERTKMESAKCCSAALKTSFRFFFMVFISTMRYHRLHNTFFFAKSNFNILNRKYCWFFQWKQ